MSAVAYRCRECRSLLLPAPVAGLLKCKCGKSSVDYSEHSGTVRTEGPMEVVGQ